ncbi:type I methionyl aminopeptidase [Candidatus Saccharibacteria bacterium]|nr:type I methionyl aminopeptidase [Candidatus Saccharibacteria bacterium]
MLTRVKTPAEIIAMRHSGKLLATVLATLKEAIEPGMTTKDLSEIAKRELRSTGGQPAFLGQYGFTDVLCVSINDEVVHGIPSEKRIINEGDLVSMDYGVTYDGMITDSAITVAVGQEINPKALQLLKDTESSLHAGIAVLRHNVYVGDIAAAVQSVLERGGYGIVRDLVGHGVGHELHEDPNIPNYGKSGTGQQLSKGMTIAIEPMATLGTHKIFVDDDGWTVKTRDGSKSAHFEHTVLITEKGAEILTSL